ncbi:transcriptional regulator with XRE-family HTH domain [Saccharothrix coeruleofusca]|uniref:helix-turn-helix domain-containing protein n=1 Tax=Saccharothrix coeruleofusca TaxID=33919 RepID=UPI0027DD7813|nr:helix-turn-helix transcriptional regulator [Saccharothrix coeruleofusca]MBP2334685.1 transcriptional regulator with XRE-family HTH domain [Saccharothrix coeruleofusca]
MIEDEQDQEHEPAGVRLAREIRRLRDQAGLSQPQLAKRIGYTRQYVSLAERADHNLPSAEIVKALDDALGASGTLIALRDQGKREQKQLRRKSAAKQAHGQPTSFMSTGQGPNVPVVAEFDGNQLLDGLRLDSPPRR